MRIYKLNNLCLKFIETYFSTEFITNEIYQKFQRYFELRATKILIKTMFVFEVIEYVITTSFFVTENTYKNYICLCSHRICHHSFLLHFLFPLDTVIE